MKRRNHWFMLDEPPSVCRIGLCFICCAAISSLAFAFLVVKPGWFIVLPDQADLLLFASRDDRIGTSNDSSSNTFISHTRPSSRLSGNCDFSRGSWVPDFTPPLYTNDTCKYIRPSQNCIQNGRQDRDYLNWKWKPNDCELLRFDATQFFELIRGKKLVFIGDSIARNHMHSLLCALAQVETPRNLFLEVKNDQSGWDFPSYNVTLTNIWSPFLVNDTFEDGIYKLQLDMPAEVWKFQLADYDMAVISTGYWYYRPSIYYLNGTTLGVNSRSNTTSFGLALPAFRLALRNVLKYMVNEYRGITILRTVTVAHFEHGTWSNWRPLQQDTTLYRIRYKARSLDQQGDE